MEKAYAVTKAADGKYCQHVWHRRFGHRNPSAIKQLEEKGLASGILIKYCGIREICECCVKEKMVRTAFPKQSQTKNKCLFGPDSHRPMRADADTHTKRKKIYIDHHRRLLKILHGLFPAI